MVNQKALLNRLAEEAQPWPEWTALTMAVQKSKFEIVTYEYLGVFFQAPSLTFAVRSITLPPWLPGYVKSLLGLQAETGEYSGGFAAAYSGDPAQIGSIFSPAGNDVDLGFPEIQPDPDLFCFQLNSSGAQFFIDKHCNIRVPNAETGAFDVLDSLEGFARKNIRATLQGQKWDALYSRELGGYTLLD